MRAVQTVLGVDVPLLGSHGKHVALRHGAEASALHRGGEGADGELAGQEVLQLVLWTDAGGYASDVEDARWRTGGAAVRGG